MHLIHCKFQDTFQDLATSSTINIGLTYAEEVLFLQPVAMIAISVHVFNDSSTKEYIDLLPFILSAVSLFI